MDVGLCDALGPGADTLIGVCGWRSHRESMSARDCAPGALRVLVGVRARVELSRPRRVGRGGVSPACGQDRRGEASQCDWLLARLVQRGRWNGTVVMMIPS